MDPYASAMAVLPVVFSKFALDPRTIIDVGCGGGEWLRAARDLGVSYTVGVGNVPYPVVEEKPNAYFCMDLREGFPGPLEDFDLALCLEVAEHLPHARGPELVSWLASLAPIVLFSAAHPGQGPYPPKDATPENIGCWHINEQTPRYWGLEFRRLGFEQRPLREIRGDTRVDPWYRENAYLYVRTGAGS